MLGLTCLFVLNDQYTFTSTNNTFGTKVIPEGTYPGGTILDVDIMISSNANWSVTGENGKYDLQGVVTHELGHFIGLCHSMIGDFWPALLFPFAATNPDGLLQRDLKPDEMAAVSAFYPSAVFTTAFGSISGRVTRQDNAKAVPSAHVFARPANDLNSVVGIYSATSGVYRIDGLLPGDYILRVEPLSAASKASIVGDRINDIVEAYNDVNFFPQIYTGTASEADATLIHVTAGNMVSNCNFSVLTGNTPDPFEPNSNITSAVLISTDGKAMIFNISDTRDYDWLKFFATAGQSYLVETAHLGLNPSMLLVLYGPDGQTPLAAGFHPEAQQSSSISFRAQQTGMHFILLDSLTVTNGAGKHMDVRVSQFSPPVYYVATNGNDTTGDGSSGNPWRTVSNTLAHASGCATNPADILVAAGTYYERITLKPHVCLRGGFSPSDWSWNPSSNPSILDGGSSGPVVTGANNSQIEGCQFRHGVAATGGGIYDQGAGALFANCIIGQCTDWSGQYGGGGVAFVNSTARLVSCVIENCAASMGGGVSYYTSQPIVIGNTIRNCEAKTVGGATGLGGGGIYCSSYSVVSGYIANNVFINCIATNASYGGRGGAILQHDAHLDFYEHNTFVGCQAQFGGGYGMWGTRYDQPHLKENTFLNCIAVQLGGGVYAYYGNPYNGNLAFNLDGNLIVSCSARCGGGVARVAGAGGWGQMHNNALAWNQAQSGGGIYVEGGRPGVTLRNNTVVGNSSTNGAAIAYSTTDSGYVSVLNNIFAGNDGIALYENTGSFGHIRNNNFFGSPSGFYRDLETASTYFSASDVNRYVSNTSYVVSNNVDWSPNFMPAPYGSASSISYNSNTYQSVLVDATASFVPGSLAGLTINPNTNQYLHFYIITNTVTTITTWADMTAVATSPCPYQVFDYHLAYDSQNIRAGTNLFAYVTTDIDGEPRPSSGPFDIGADQFVSSTGDWLADYWKVRHGLKPYNLDNDGNGLSDGWEYWYFGQPTGTDPFGNPTGDGIVNLMKYALALDPWLASVSGLPSAVLTTNGYLTLTYRQNKQATNLNFAVQACSLLTDGSWSTNGLTSVSIVDCNTWWNVTIRDAVPISSATNRFMRLKVTKP